MKYEIGDTIKYVCPKHGNVSGTLIREQRTAYGDRMYVLVDEAGNIRRVCYDRVHKHESQGPKRGSAMPNLR